MSDVLDNATIADTLADSTPLAARCERLVEQSIAQGGRDNSTVILIEGCEGPDGVGVTPNVVWTFDPATGETSGQLEVAPVAPAREQASEPGNSPQSTQMMSVSEIEQALAGREAQMQTSQAAEDAAPRSNSLWLIGIAIAAVVVLVSAFFLP
jgi:hypothetical protein